MKKTIAIFLSGLFTACSSPQSKVKDLVEVRELRKGNKIHNITLVNEVKNSQMGAIRYTAKTQDDKIINDSILVSITGDGVASEVAN